MLLSTLLIPFGLQFAHAFESHEAPDCNATQQEHIHEHEFDCDVFHFKINTEVTAFNTQFEVIKIEIPGEEVIGSDFEFRSTQINYESSRAPPILLF